MPQIRITGRAHRETVSIKFGRPGRTGRKCFYPVFRYAGEGRTQLGQTKRGSDWEKLRKVLRNNRTTLDGRRYRELGSRRKRGRKLTRKEIAEIERSPLD